MPFRKLWWKATYENGETISSREGKGYYDIDISRLIYFDLYISDFLLFRYWQDRPTKRLIYRIRTLKRIGKNAGENKLILVGWQETINGKNYQSIVCIFDDGHMEMIGKWGKGIYSKPLLKKWESEKNGFERNKPKN